MVKIRSKKSEGIFINQINNISQASWIFGLNVQFSTSVLQEFIKHARPDYLVKVTDFFSLTLLNKNNESSQHNSHLGWMNQNYTYFVVRTAKKYIFSVCYRILVISLCVPWDEKYWKLLS